MACEDRGRICFVCVVGKNPKTPNWAHGWWRHYTGLYRRSGISRVYLWTEWTHNDQEVHQGYCQLEIVQTVGGFLKFWQIKGKILLKALIAYTDIALCCIDNLHISHNALGMEANIWVLLINNSSSYTSGQKKKRFVSQTFAKKA